MASLKFGKRTVPLPASRAARLALGGGLMVAGVVGFLPILGFWMLPLGVVVLSVDVPAVRRWRRRTVVWWHRRRRGTDPDGRPVERTPATPGEPDATGGAPTDHAPADRAVRGGASATDRPDGRRR